MDEVNAGVHLDNRSAFSENGRGAADEGMVWEPISQCDDYHHTVDPRQQVVRESERTLNMRATVRSSAENIDGAVQEQPIDMFFAFLPVTWIINVMLPAMTLCACVDNPQADAFTWEHLQEMLGVFMYYAPLSDIENFRGLWSSNTSGLYRRAAHAPSWYGIPRHRYEKIMKYFGCLTPSEIDPQHPVKGLLKMVAAFNAHWSEVFRSSWLACMDESVIKATSTLDYLRVRVCISIYCSIVVEMITCNVTCN